MSEETKTILVTGGAGFIGKSLITSLVSAGHEVIAMDNFYSSLANFRDLAQLPSPDDVEWIRHDVREPFSVRCDEIYHLACPASPPTYQEDPIYTIETCVKGTINAFKCAEEVGARVLLASTSEVYGEPLEHPQAETLLSHVNSIGPRACYDLGKAISESVAITFSEERDVETRIARIFNTYGPGMDPADGRVISNFICQAIAAEPITVYGDGLQTRSFCHVSDMVRGLRRLMDIDIAEGVPVNLGNPDERTILSIAKRIIEITGSPSEIVFEDLPVDDPTRRCPDVSVAGVLGWRPTTDLDRGLIDTISYFERL